MKGIKLRGFFVPHERVVVVNFDLHPFQEICVFVEEEILHEDEEVTMLGMVWYTAWGAEESYMTLALLTSEGRVIVANFMAVDVRFHDQFVILKEYNGRYKHVFSTSWKVFASLQEARTIAEEELFLEASIVVSLLEEMEKKLEEG